MSIFGVECTELKKFCDHRGWLSECFREDELPPEIKPVMMYISETLPGVARGPHEHKTQTDIFMFLGPGMFRVYLWDARENSPTSGEKMVFLAGAEYPCRVVVPPGVVHAYKCVSTTPGWVLNAPDKLYAGKGKKEPVDEIRHEEETESRYIME